MNAARHFRYMICGLITKSTSVHKTDYPKCGVLSVK